MNLKALQTEIKQVEQSRDIKAIEQFLARHPILTAFGYTYLGGAWLLRACVWTLAFLLAVVGLKVLWLAVLFMWRLV